MRGRLWAWLLVALGLLPAWLVRARSAAPAPAAPAPPVIAVTAAPNSLDPAKGRNVAAALVDDNVFETLFRLTPDGRLVPGLAASATVSGRRVVVRIPARRLSDGRTVTAGTVGRALARALWPGVGSPLAPLLLQDVAGAARVASGQTRWIQGVTAPAADRLVIRLKQPDPTFLDRLANPALAIVPVADMNAGGPYWTVTDLVGTGPYRLAATTPAARWTLERVRGRGPASVSVMRYPDWTTALLGFANGEVAAVPVPWSEVGQIPAGLRRDLRVLPTGGRLQLVVARHPGDPWATPGSLAGVMPAGGLAAVVRTAFAGTVSVGSGARLAPTAGAAPVVRAPLRLAVEADQPMAVRLAQVWARQAHGRLVVTPLGAAALQAAIRQGTVDAAVLVSSPDGPPVWPATVPATRRTLAAAGAPWLVRPEAPRLTAFPDGSLDLSSWR
ncbi:MAG: hypothetical protein K6V97_06560 [Actinomycetia bacterium]|nr:hypothetical protein [Actinomycetes bacterium]